MMNELVFTMKVSNRVWIYIFPTQQQSEWNGCVSMLVNMFVMFTWLDCVGCKHFKLVGPLTFQGVFAATDVCVQVIRFTLLVK